MHCNPVLYQPCLLKMHLNKGHSGARWTVLQTVCRALPIDYQLMKKFVDSFSQKHTTVLSSLGGLPAEFQSGHAGNNDVGEKWWKNAFFFVNLNKYILCFVQIQQSFQPGQGCKNEVGERGFSICFIVPCL